jgi:ribonuclease HI
MAYQKVTAYTDGACKGNPGPGGWAFVIVNDQNQIAVKRNGFKSETTNNEMELTAIHLLLHFLKSNYITERDIVIYSDSTYAIKCITEWGPKWTFNDWIKKANSHLINRCMELLCHLKKFNSIRFEYVKGHSGNQGNELVDKLANEAILRGS